jgi:hypothetical protein
MLSIYDLLKDEIEQEQPLEIVGCAENQCGTVPQGRAPAPQIACIDTPGELYIYRHNRSSPKQTRCILLERFRWKGSLHWQGEEASEPRKSHILP